MRKVAIFGSGNLGTDLLIKIEGLALKAEDSIADYKRRLGVANTAFPAPRALPASEASTRVAPCPG